MALRLLLEVGARELEGVEEGVGGGVAHVFRRLLLLHPVNDGRQDLVRLGLKNVRVLRERGKRARDGGSRIKYGSMILDHARFE